MSRFPSDRTLSVLLLACGGSAALILAMIILFISVEALPALTPDLLLDDRWLPSHDRFGILPMLIGSLALMLGAVALAGPLGLGCALALRLLTPSWPAQGLRRILELLAGVPSVVIGLWGLTSIVPLVGGASLLAGILVLTPMILPTVAIGCDAALGGVPVAQWRAARALGLSDSRALLTVILPQARAGIATALLLAAGRAIGETMAVLMVCGNVVRVPESLSSPVRAITSNIALEMAYAMDQHRAALYASALVLIILVSALVAAGRGMVRYG